MSKIQYYHFEIKNILIILLENGNDEHLIHYLEKNSNLPGPRGNLELAYVFIAVVQEFKSEELNILWKRFTSLLQFNSDVAPTNSSKEFLPFCGILGLCGISIIDSKYIPEMLEILEKAATDSRWRIREGVAHALGQILERNKDIIEVLEEWTEKQNLLVYRALLAGFASPPLLRNKSLAQKGLEFHKKAFLLILSNKVNRELEDFRVLRKGLAYTLSVIIAALPIEGFSYLDRIITTNDKDIKWILKQNLLKNRLKKNFPEKVIYYLNKLS